MANLFRRLLVGVPDCPVCEGPCTHEFTRGPYQIGGNMPRTADRDPDDASGEPTPRKKPRPNRRGRRPEHHAPEHPAEDRMRRAAEDR